MTFILQPHSETTSCKSKPPTCPSALSQKDVSRKVFPYTLTAARQAVWSLWSDGGCKIKNLPPPCSSSAVCWGLSCSSSSLQDRSVCGSDKTAQHLHQKDHFRNDSGLKTRKWYIYLVKLLTETIVSFYTLIPLSFLFSYVFIELQIH